MSLVPFRRGAVLLGLAAVGLVVASAGQAALRKLDFVELVDTARSIVHGRVVETRSFFADWSSPGDAIIVTEVVLEPITVLKGGDPGERVVFRIPGGKVGELEVVASEAPLVLPAGEVLVFLAHHELGFDYVYAHWQGKYDVVTSVDPAGDRRVKGLQGAPIARDVSLPDLAVSVRTAMAKAAKARAEREEGQ